jgi:uncharacterized protein YecT (DUF1311 family)
VRLTALILPLLVAVSPAFAQDYDCVEPATQLDLNFCARDDFGVADAELNAIWKDARKVAKDEDALRPDEWEGLDKALLAAQRDWIAYRDSQCEFVSFIARGGSMEQMLLWRCKAALTRGRANYLRDFSTLELKDMLGREQ